MGSLLIRIPDQTCDHSISVALKQSAELRVNCDKPCSCKQGMDSWVNFIQDNQSAYAVVIVLCDCH